MENDSNVPVTLVGDEESAQGIMGVASILKTGSSRYYTPDSMTEVYRGPNGVTVTVHMDCPYHLMVPQTYQDDPSGLYQIGLIGYSHRKDAIVPSGLLQSSYVGYPGDIQFGNETYYISDGMAVHGACIGSASTEKLYPEVFDATVCLAGAVTEDVMNARHGAGGTGSGTPQGIRPTKRYFTASRVVGMQGDNTFSLTPHKVDRSGAKPTYTALLGYSYMVSTSPVTQYSGQDLVTSYYEMQHRFGYVTEGEAGASYNAYYLADDFADTTTKDWSSCWPVIWNVSNGKSVVLHRHRNSVPSNWFGGTFGLTMTLIEGPDFLLYPLSVAPLLSGYSYANTWSFMEADYPNNSTTYGYSDFAEASTHLFVPHDYLRMAVLLFDFGLHLRKAAVTLTDGTIVTFSRRLRLHRVPTSYSYGSQLCCFSVAEGGITQLSVLDTYWDFAEYSGSEDAQVPRKNYDSLRAIAINTTTILLFYDKQVETGVGSNTYVSAGWFRRVSTNGGVTWAPEEQITFSGVAAQWEWSRPRVVADVASVGVAKLISGYIAKTESGTTKTYTAASVLLSEDGGLTWVLSGTAAPSINYQAPAGALFVNGDAGLGSLHNHGCWEDGYEPSPHKHLPNFYGIPTKICRDSTGDPNL